MRCVLFSILSIFLSLQPIARATIIDIPADYPTIQQGIDASIDGDTVLVQPGTYVENINFHGHNIVLGSLFLIARDTTLILSTIIDGSHSGPVIFMENIEDSTAVITGFTIKNGRTIAGGGIYCRFSNPSILYNIICDNEAIGGAFGGGIDCWYSDPIIRSNKIYRNKAESEDHFGQGGGISCANSSPVIENNIIAENEASGHLGGAGGGISIHSGSPVIAKNIVTDNLAISGGGIYCATYSYTVIQDNIIKRNSAEYGGGISSFLVGEIYSNIITENYAIYEGGGISNRYSSPLVINNTIFKNNAGDFGGGFYNYGSSPYYDANPIVQNTIFWDNGPQEIYNEGGEPQISYCDIMGGWEGGGNIDCDPMMCDIDSDNFHLQSNSCCIGAGINGADIGALGPGCGIYLEIASVDGFPGGMIQIPVTLYTWEFRMGGMEIHIGWDPIEIELVEINPTGRLDEGNEYWNIGFDDPCEDCPDDDGVRVTWISDMNDGIPHPPAYEGYDPIFIMTFNIKDDLPWGMILPIEFIISDYSDNTVSDSSGYVWFRPELINGRIEVIDPARYKGDPNLNGYFFEVGDAVLVARRLVYGYSVWSENGIDDDAIQESSADLNNNGVPDIADLIRFINIINGAANPPKPSPVRPVAEVSISHVFENKMEVMINSDIEIGGVFLEIKYAGIELGNPVSEEMDCLASDENGIIRMVVYSLEGNTIAAGNTTILTIPVVSNEDGPLDVTEASFSDIYGRLLEPNPSAYSPLPAAYDILPNYPNPFNAQTTIQYSLPEQSHITIDIFDILGRKIETLAEGVKPAGNYQTIWNASGQASGIYFYQIKAGEYSKTNKMLFLK